MNTFSLNLAIAIVIMFGFVPTHEIRFPGIKGSGCARINNTVPQPKIKGQLWRVTHWMKNRRKRHFSCFKDDFENDILATQQNVFLATDKANYAIKLICLAGDSPEEKDAQHNYLVHTYANTPTPSPKIMHQIKKAHVKHGLSLKWLRWCKISNKITKHI